MNAEARMLALRALLILKAFGGVSPQSERGACVAAARDAVRRGEITMVGAWTAAMLAQEYLPALRAEQAAKDSLPEVQP